MRKHLAVLMAMLSLTAMADLPIATYSLTNAMSWVGVNINVSNVSNLPYRVSETPGDAFLGLYRAFFCKDFESVFYHASDRLRLILAGTANITQISQDSRGMFNNSACCTNMIILSVQPILTNSCELTIKANILEATFEESDNAFMFIVLSRTNETWKIGGIYTDEHCSY